MPFTKNLTANNLLIVVVVVVTYFACCKVLTMSCTQLQIFCHCRSDRHLLTVNKCLHFHSC